MKPYMTSAETAAFTRYRDRSRNYFEFGCGGSTVFCNSPLRKIKSVDNNQEWLNKVRPLIGSTTELIYINTGPVLEYGNPADPTQIAGFADYSLAFSQRDPNTDLVLVDGRFRVACALQIVVSDYTGIVLLHDAERPEYQPLFKFFTVVERVENLVALRVRSSANKKEAGVLWEIYKNIHK
jgi:protein O-GlcNAc transferase